LPKKWPLIAGQIQNLNRTCEFCVTTVHNPLRVSSPSDPLNPLYPGFEVLLASLNGTIKAGELIWGYRVVDANKGIKNTPAVTILMSPPPWRRLKRCWP
jgi:hypothetical protein